VVGGPGRKEALKVGYVYVGPVGDHGWSYRHDQGRLAVEKHFAGKVKTTFVENVAEGPDAERVIRQLASSGHGLVFTTSFGFMNPTEKVARQFKNVRVRARHGLQAAREPRDLRRPLLRGPGRHRHARRAPEQDGQGRLRRLVPDPEVVMGINAFTVAMRKIRPTRACG
jgi:simple sugar transport system substrate-binding protein